MREEKVLETPVSKQKVIIKAWLTGREKREINSVLFAETSFSTEQLKNPDIAINSNLINKMQDKLLETVVISVDDKTDKVVETILDMRSQDFDFVISEIDKVTKSDEELKKK